MESAGDGVERCNHGSRISAKEQVHCHTTHERHFEFRCRTLGHSHVLVQLDAYDYAIVVTIIIINVTDNAHRIAVSINGIGDSKPFDVLKLDIVGIARLENIDAFEEVDAYKEQDARSDSGECDFDFASNLEHVEKFSFCHLA